MKRSSGDITHLLDHLFVFLTQGAAPSAPAPTPRMPSSTGGQDIVEILAGDSRFTQLVTLVDGAGLVPPLQGEGPLTVFAPTNQAFNNLGLPADTSPEDIEAVLLYHVVGGAVSLENGLTVTTLNGADVLLTVTDTEIKVNDANIRQTIAASNGIIYVIDAVLLPPSGTRGRYLRA